MQSTLINLLSESVNSVPDKIAVIHSGSSLSYSELWKMACGIAHYLVDNGIQNGDRIALLIENSVEYIVSYYGVLMAGGSVVALNTAAKSRDLANWIEHSESSFLFLDNKHNEFNRLLDVIKPDLKKVFVTDYSEMPDVMSLERIECADDIPDITVSMDPRNQLASIIYTSGTTGRPKGVMLSHYNIYKNIQSILDYLKLTENDSILNVLPFYYSYGNSILHIHLAVGGTLVLENSMLYPQKVVSLMSEYKVTGFSGVPSTFNLLLSRVDLSNYDLSSVRYMTQAGGPMAPVNIERLKRVMPDIDFYVMYGQTEASARLSYLPPEMLEAKLGSIGIAIPGVELEVMDENGELVMENTTGEIFAKGDNIMLGYWKDEQATDNVIHNGWLKTGDLAYKDRDGYLYIVGRSSEMIKSGAHRISPKDIEEVILELDGVEEVAVVGVEDDLLGQVIKAVIVKKLNYYIEKIEIMRHCKMNLANYKLPKFIEFVNEIPRTASGKVQRFKLQD